MTSALAEPLVLPPGEQRPRLFCAPTGGGTAGAEAVELAEAAGLHLDPWQQHVLEVALNEAADGRWAAFEVCLLVARQNGKGRSSRRSNWRRCSR